MYGKKKLRRKRKKVAIKAVEEKNAYSDWMEGVRGTERGKRRWTDS